jgi:hypothetical protein
VKRNRYSNENTTNMRNYYCAVGVAIHGRDSLDSEPAT